MLNVKLTKSQGGEDTTSPSQGSLGQAMGMLCFSGFQPPPRIPYFWLCALPRQNLLDMQTPFSLLQSLLQKLFSRTPVVIDTSV